MDFSTHSLSIPVTIPEFEHDAERIVRELRAYSSKEIAKLMKVSSVIAESTLQKYQAWGSVKQAGVYAYRGDVYKGFYADTLTKDDQKWANDHVMILSGLYGVLRLADEVSAYRLEMNLRVPVDGAKNLYGFWGDKLAQFVEQQADGIVCVLSSKEYARPVTSHITQSLVVTPVFMDKKPNGAVGSVPIYSKMMRGVMARWIIDNRVDTIEGLNDFSGHGYSYDSERSTKFSPVFSRKTMAPLQFAK